MNRAPVVFTGLTNVHAYDKLQGRIKNTPWGLLYGEKKDHDVSKFRQFGCRAWMHINKVPHEKGKTAPTPPRAVEVVNLFLA